MTLIKRKLRPTDAAELVSWLPHERDVLSWGGPYFDFPLRVGAINALIAEHRGKKPSRECWALGDCDGRFVGTFQLAYNFRSGQASLGRVLLHPLHRGRGLARKIIRHAEDSAFQRSEINRLELRVFTFNQPAVSAYIKAGFILEGEARQTARLGADYWDDFIMSKLRSERSV
ncbi:GNAT family N-acetyltransferase [Tateyamaria sp. SN3-11]|uniref:GNAT family N-acetyltransferase n=1 Tax=Tateyamaria sp. SN3-11 TaxID=3092147 RepID=UPI0039EA1E1D